MTRPLQFGPEHVNYYPRTDLERELIGSEASKAGRVVLEAVQAEQQVVATTRPDIHAQVDQALHGQNARHGAAPADSGGSVRGETDEQGRLRQGNAARIAVAEAVPAAATAVR